MQNLVFQVFRIRQASIRIKNIVAVRAVFPSSIPWGSDAESVFAYAEFLRPDVTFRVENFSLALMG